MAGLGDHGGEVMRGWCGAIAGVVLASSAPAAERPVIHPMDVAQPATYPAEILVFVEIPAGGGTKYETDKQTGFVFVDRFLAGPGRYPTNYGSVPQTRMPDGDPLDALVLTRLPVRSGVMIRVRPIGVMRMRDGEDVDDKIVAVPTTALDSSFDGIATLKDLPPIQLAEIAAFFRSYKALPEGRGPVEIPGFDGPEAARPLAESTHRAYLEAQD